jgi:hypothetical protein
MPLFNTFNTLSINGFEQPHNSFTSAKLLSEMSDGTLGAKLGTSIAITDDGNTLVVGAPSDDGGKGAAYVYSKTGTIWSLVTKLVAPIRYVNNSFGKSVCINDNTIVVGDPLEDDGAILNKGAAYMYTKISGVWQYTLKITASSGNADAKFGESVSISSAVTGRMTICAPGTTVGGKVGQGVVYVYSSTTASLIQTITRGSFLGTNSGFGNDAKISGDSKTLIIGSANLSAATVYELDATGTYILKTTFSGGGNVVYPGGSFSNAYFGWAVAISYNGDTVVIGEPFKNVTNSTFTTQANSPITSPQGSIAIYKRTSATWANTSGGGNRVSTPSYLPLSYTMKYFGSSVDISNDGTQVLVGAYGSTINTTLLQGDAHKLQLTAYSSTFGITQQYNLIADDGKANDLFGTAVALSGDGITMVVGAPTSLNVNPGSIYIYTNP